jgi:cytochrome c-type biogenesis protein CcmF
MPELGLYSLRFALVIAVIGMGVSVYAGRTRQHQWTQVAERAMWTVFGFTSVAMLALFYALGTNNFELSYVSQHSARTMPLHYRLSALWGGQAGSLLLWLWMLCIYGAAAVATNRKTSPTLTPWVIATLLLNATFFLVLTNFVTNPFERLPPNHVFSDGNGLNPLLQHPMMTIHPLMLYTGFVGFAVPFAYGLAAMITGELDTAWFRITRRWTLFAWTVLGAGLLLGGRWAYEVLGWGGYWAWDPVENAALMPWLAATAYLHSVMVQEKRDMLKTWNLVLIGLTYTLCLFGTFLTRSGVVQSVHSFTNSGWFGFVFLGYVAVIAGIFFSAVIYRRKELASPNRLESMVSREASFLYNNWGFMALLVVVFWGTMLPVFSETFTGWVGDSAQRTTVGPKFFNTMAGPIALFLLFLTGVGPLIAWGRATPASLRKQFTRPALFGTVAGAILAVMFWGSLSVWTLACWTLSAFVVATISPEYWSAIRARMRRGESPVRAFSQLMRKNQRRYGGYVVHLGIVLLLIGVSGAAFNEEILENVRPGDSVELHDYRLRYLTADAIPAQHYGGAKARVALYRGDTPLRVMTPEKRMYWLEQQPTSIPAVYSTLQEDLYLILSAVEPDGSATLKIYRNPLVSWIWLGGLVYIIGSILIMWPHSKPEQRTA